jgi:CPA2 family monovalent cation:H+ antiporter-2
MLVASAIVSITINPLLFRAAQAWSGSRGRRSDGPGTGEVSGETREHRAVVVGFGPVGQTVTRLLRENGIDVTVVEMNLESVRGLRNDGIPAEYGDATHEETLVRAGVATARALVLSSGTMSNLAEVIRVAKALRPEIRVLARTNYVREIPTTLAAGAAAAFSGEGEVALAMTEEILTELGASGEQLDRERDRVRAELALPMRTVPATPTSE